MNMFKLKKHLSTISIVLVSIFCSALITFASTIPIAPSLFETSLATPISKTDTSMTLANGTLANGSLLSGYTCFTVDSGTPSVEFICGTASGTSITSLIRGIDTLTGNTTTSSLVFSHRRGANVKITDFPAFSIVRNIANGQDTLPNPISYATGVTPLNAQDLTTKSYVLSVVSGGTVSFSQVVVSGKAGETLSAGNVVYLKSDGQWWKAKGNDTSTTSNVQLGIAQGTGTSGNTITGGVLIKGTDTNNTGTAGNFGYVSNAGGAVATSAGTYTTILGQYMVGNAGFYFNPTYLSVSQGVYSSQNPLVTLDNVHTADTDQVQSTQNGTIEFGTANTTSSKNKIQQSFIPTKTKTRGVKLYKNADTGTFTGTVIVALYADSAGSPSGSALATQTISSADWLALPVGEFEADFSAEYSMTAGNLYWIQISSSTADTSNHPNLGTNTAGGYANGSVKYWNTTDGYVAIANIDLYFKILQGTINQIIETDSTGKIPLSLQNYTNKFTSGVFSKDLSEESTVQTIAHGIGTTPKRIKLTAITSQSNALALPAFGVFDSSGNRSISYYPPGGSPAPLGVSESTTAFLIYGGSGSYQSGVISVDETNIKITWTKNNFPTGLAEIMWEAEY